MRVKLEKSKKRQGYKPYCEILSHTKEEKGKTARLFPHKYTKTRGKEMFFCM